MSNTITVTFIGTTSGGGPTETRNCSSLVVDALGNGSLWMVDCAEGTVRQFEHQPYRPGQPRFRMSQVSKIFITHMHADHTMGTLTFLRNVLGIPKPKVPGENTPPNFFPPRIEIFGPRGIRRMLRMLWHTTHTHSEYSYVVHELLFPGEQPSVPAEVLKEGADEIDVRRESECVGRDIWCDTEGFWRGIVNVPVNDGHANWGALVDAGPIEHRDPCIGYVIREIPRGRVLLGLGIPVPRKLVILGDTHNPSPIIPLIHSDPHFAADLPEVDPLGTGVLLRVPVTLLVHEATDAYIPPSIDTQARTGRNRTEESVQAKTLERGHSTPAMAGAFARKIGAERLVMNHIGARFPAPDMNYSNGAQAKFRAACMREIERQAAEAWDPRRRMQPQAAWDFLSIALPPNQSWKPMSCSEARTIPSGPRVRAGEEARGAPAGGSTVPPGAAAESSTAGRRSRSRPRAYETENGHGDERSMRRHERDEYVPRVRGEEAEASALCGQADDEHGHPQTSHGDERKRRAETFGSVGSAGAQMFTWRVGDNNWKREGTRREYSSHAGSGRGRGKRNEDKNKRPRKEKEGGSRNG